MTFKQNRCYVCGETEFLTLQSSYNVLRYACPGHIKPYKSKAIKVPKTEWDIKASDINDKLMRKYA